MSIFSLQYHHKSSWRDTKDFSNMTDGLSKYLRAFPLFLFQLQIATCVPLLLLPTHTILSSFTCSFFPGSLLLLPLARVIDLYLSCMHHLSIFIDITWSFSSTLPCYISLFPWQSSSVIILVVSREGSLFDFAHFPSPTALIPHLCRTI